MFNQSIRTKARVDQPAPEWTAEDLEGRKVSLSDFRGRVVLLNLWTTWCITCKEETPALLAFHERYGDRVTVIGLDVREPVRTIRRYLEENGVTYRVLRDRIGRAADRYNLKGYPETWFIDAQGVARAFWQGPMTFEQMQALYRQATGRPIDGGGVGPVRAGDRLAAAALEPGAPDAPGAVWAGTGTGLKRGDAAGPPAAWHPVGGHPEIGRAPVTALALPPGAPGAVLAALRGVGVLRSRDGGRTWQDAGGGLPAKDVSALAASADGRVAYAWVTGQGLFRSEDAGGSWRPVAGGAGGPAGAGGAGGPGGAGGLDPRLPVVALGVDPGDADHVLASWAHEALGLTEGRLLESRDGGRTFAEVPVEEEIIGIRTRPAVFGIAFDPDRPGTVYLATAKGVWKSEAGGRGARWLRRSHARRFAAVSAAGGSLLAAAPNGDLYVSRDAGATWELLSREREG